MSLRPTGSMPTSTLFGIIEQQGDARLSLDELVGFKSPSVFAYQYEGRSMEPLIISGDRLIIDRSIKANHNDIVVMEYNGQILCRRFLKNNSIYCFMADNKAIRNIVPSEGESINIVGVVKHIVRHL